MREAFISIQQPLCSEPALYATDEEGNPYREDGSVDTHDSEASRDRSAALLSHEISGDREENDFSAVRQDDGSIVKLKRGEESNTDWGQGIAEFLDKLRALGLKPVYRPSCVDDSPKTGEARVESELAQYNHFPGKPRVRKALRQLGVDFRVVDAKSPDERLTDIFLYGSRPIETAGK